VTSQLELGTPLEMHVAWTGSPVADLDAGVGRLLAEKPWGFRGVLGVDVAVDRGPGHETCWLVLTERRPGEGLTRLVWSVRSSPAGRHESELAVVVTGHKGEEVAVDVIAPGASAQSPRIRGPLPLGEQHHADYPVTTMMTTGHVTGRAPVLSTPALVGCMEQTAKRLADPHLATGYSVVGVEVDIKHRAVAFEGQTLHVSATLIGRLNTRLRVRVEVTCGTTLIGDGRVTSQVVPSPANPGPA
jgi:predicted thioesterase